MWNLHWVYKTGDSLYGPKYKSNNLWYQMSKEKDYKILILDELLTV